MSSDDQEPHVYLVTGATGAIGEAIALGLAKDPRIEVVLGCRNGHKGKATAERIAERTGNSRVRFSLLDVSLAESIQALVKDWRGPLHGLVNNAAIAPRTRQTTVEGIESVFATNVLGYFRMIRECLPLLRSGAPARIVNVASYWSGGLELDDLQFDRRAYDNDSAYRQSKQADRMLTAAFAPQLPDGVVVNACHPGDVDSQLSRDLGFSGHESPEMAARTPVELALGIIGAEANGAYFEHGKQKACRFAKDREAFETLYATCERFD